MLHKEKCDIFKKFRSRIDVIDSILICYVLISIKLVILRSLNYEYYQYHKHSRSSNCYSFTN
jgi:hypothetical protein